MTLKDLKVVFMGTPEFSLNVLEMLIEKTNLLAVVTQPDKIVGKNKEKSFPPVKELAEKHHIMVLQPEKIRYDYESILKLNPDIIITCAYGQIIPIEILSVPKYGCINVHASLLPKLRGGSPLHHAIIDGYDKTGVTIMYMDSKMDSGDIISQREIPIKDNDTVGTIHDKLSIMGRDLLLETLPSIVNGTNQRIKQNEDEVTFCHNITHEEEKIDFYRTCREIFNQVRGMNPYPVSYLTLNDKIYKIYQVSYQEGNSFCNSLIGEVVIQNKEQLGIKALDGIIYLEELKKEGKKKMSIKDFLNGGELLKGLVANRSNDE